MRDLTYDDAWFLNYAASDLHAVRLCLGQQLSGAHSDVLMRRRGEREHGE